MIYRKPCQPSRLRERSGGFVLPSLRQGQACKSFEISGSFARPRPTGEVAS